MGHFCVALQILLVALPTPAFTLVIRTVSACVFQKHLLYACAMCLQFLFWAFLTWQPGHPMRILWHSHAQKGSEGRREVIYKFFILMSPGCRVMKLLRRLEPVSLSSGQLNNLFLIGSPVSTGSFFLSSIPISWNYTPNKPLTCKCLTQSVFSGRVRIKIPEVVQQSTEKDDTLMEENFINIYFFPFKFSINM